jgi:surface protein
MNTTTLNMTTLDGGRIIKRGEGGGVTINNQDKVVDITENGTTEVVADGGYTGLGKVTINTEVSGGSSKPKWTGHADAEGLKAIGWTDEDIAYYQENGVNWNEEDDQYHKVSEDNKALYGVLTASNISSYKNRIVYLPKIDTSGVTRMTNMFDECYSLTAIPMLDTSSVTRMNGMFYSCRSLTSIPMLDTSSVTTMDSMFQNCYSLTAIPMLDTSKVTSMYNMFNNCYSLTAIPMLDTSSVTTMDSMFYSCCSLTAIPMLDTSSVTSMGYMFSTCYSLTAIPMLDTSKVTNMGYMFSTCYSLTHANLKNVKLAYTFNISALLSKDSLLYIINNEAATSAITIKLASYAYDKWANDPDIVAALANHPNISISK